MRIIFCFPILLTAVRPLHANCEGEKDLGLTFPEVFPDPDPIHAIKVGINEVFAEEIFDDAEPLVIKNAAATKWHAMKRWTREYIVEKVGELDVHASEKPMIRMHSAVHPIGQLPGIHWTRPWNNATVLTSEFFSLTEAYGSCPLESKDCEIQPESTAKAQEIEGEEPKKYYYFFSKLSDIPSLANDVGDIHQLIARFRPTMEVNLWMGSRGIGTPLHYDVAHNMYVQVSGKKRFRMFSPEAHSNVYLFPRVHPASRMSQVDMNHIRKDVFPLFTGEKPLEVTLTKGDILYIPPYWFHSTEVIETHSISVSVCSESSQVDLREKIFLDSKLEFETDLSFGARIRALAAYIRYFFREEDRKETHRSLLKAKGFVSVLSRRFEKLSYDCEVKGLTEVAEIARKRFDRVARSLDKSPTDLERRIIDHAEKRANYLLAKYEYSKGTAKSYTKVEWEIELGNHIEDIVTMVLESPMMVLPMLQYVAMS
ncbi:hypothetical protein AAMO2058_000605000 [Amorphochlora amoebiformis]